MENPKMNSTKYIEELEDKIIEQSFQLKQERGKVNSISQSHEKLMQNLIHNLKNPIGVIFSYSDMILEDVNQLNPDKLQKYVEIIKNAADYSVRFLNQTSKLSILSSQDVSFILKKLNLTELLNQVINQFEKIALKNKITLKRDFNIVTPLLLIDEEQLTQSLSNIINNAIRFSNENTTIIISAMETEESVKIVITDEGIGVETENLKNIFTEYFVVNTYSSDKNKCVGLGLTIAKKIIQKHQGSISFESILGKGSSVKILLPKK